ncbi:TIGR04282 family arsenosugar biosynthesis glycosyltransferase [Nocardioides hwasunensis]|uniref:DUF2064 domain-containing protein n=1 Tax=Nocardioides hwasunensis TaxID=397258 RepID=A0ABR8MFD1_9ACTN|nr:DUF2064 domain-containing protein [Nocardioides hwasunensis]MBD3914788.1 DUF2064 domain-containing protein [Nocardioides hwasunensis]
MRALIVAKAPVAGRVKTRLGAVIGDDLAADLAAAALLDTIEACTRAGAVGHVSLAGDLADAVRGEEIGAALTGWTITAQRGAGFAERLVNAHADAGHGAVVQVGMDTPQITPAGLASVAEGLVDHDAVLAPATDGGWWALARRDPDVVRHLVDVEMSTDRTFVDTWEALERAGCRVGHGVEISDVDTVEDADRVADLAPQTRFADMWRTSRVRGAR